MVAVDVAQEAGEWRTTIRTLPEEVDCDAISKLRARDENRGLASGSERVKVLRNVEMRCRYWRRRTADVRKLRHDAIEGRHGEYGMEYGRSPVVCSSSGTRQLI